MTIMQIPRESMAIRQVGQRLAEILDDPNLVEDTQFEVRTNVDHIWDAVFIVRGYSFVLEWKRAGSLGPVAAGIRQLEMAKQNFPCEVISLLAVPYMGKVAQERCEQAEVPWLDLSGNARIVVPGIFYQNLGNPNRFRRVGRPESAFGPKGSRFARQLLMGLAKTIKQCTLASSTGLNEGHVSRVNAKLLEASLVGRRESGIRVTEFGTLLDAWREEYRFGRLRVFQGHISAGGGDSLTHYMAGTWSKIGAF